MVTTAAALISVAVLKVGDVLIVPPGVIRGWADIPDHVDYLSFRRRTA